MIIYRDLNEADYEDICDISKDIWEGNDYLPSVFHKWIKSPGYFLGAVDTEKNKVIGVGKYSILHDKTGWLEGLRVHKDYRGLKIARGISEGLLEIAKKDAEIEIKNVSYHGRQQCRTIAKREPKLEVFTKEEIDLINRTVLKWKEYNAKEISEKSHLFFGWNIAEENETIPYPVALLNIREPTRYDQRKAQKLAPKVNNYIRSYAF